MWWGGDRIHSERSDEISALDSNGYCAGCAASGAVCHRAIHALHSSDRGDWFLLRAQWLRTERRIEMKRRQMAYLAFAMIGIVQIACYVGAAPGITRNQPTPVNIPIAIVEMPKVLRRGESGTFSIKTEPRNWCRADIQYTDESGNRAAKNLAESQADEGGTCTWVWTVPVKASVGTAWFSARVGRGDQSFMPIPTSFCIEQCPY